jgi:hypothetical protein
MVVSPVTPTKNKMVEMNKKIEENKVVDKLSKMGDFLDKVELKLQKLISFSDKLTGLLLIDKYCPFTLPSSSFPVTTSICSSLNVPLDTFKVALAAIDSFLVKYLAFFSDITGLLDTIGKFINMIDMSVFDIISKIFNGIDDFLNYRIEACIDWTCWTTESSCFNIRYPCGTKWCSRWRIRYPCGVNWCDSRECVSYPVPYSCPQCTGCSILDLINGVLSALKVLLDALNSVMAMLASELDINFPTISIPGLPSIDFIVKIQNIFASLFDDIFVDVNFLKIDEYFEDLIKKLDFTIPNIRSFCK